MTDNDIYELIRRNQDIQRKFFEIETEILTVLDFTSLFVRLLNLMRNRCNVPYAWISLIADSDAAALVRTLANAEDLDGQLNTIDRDTFLDITRGRMTPVLRNQGLAPFTALYPEPRPADVRSIAVAPITLDGALIGSLNQADTSPTRFAPDMNTDLLAQLAVKVSLCLSNVTAHERLRMLATCDPLTSLLNRRAMDQRLRTEYARAKRYDSPLSIVFIDLDDFKTVNDTLGHDAGDRLLAFFAKQIAAMVRTTDTCARYAGDEFVIILPETTATQTHRFMTRAAAQLADTPVPGIETAVRFSFGVAEAHESGVTDHASLLRLADQRLYNDKRSKNIR
ncbi:diguanylate cyclase (GGDEF)-like protein [Desulfobaculum xiamenense]|uniref:diguanylate cyclase n=1 Tax=Desulfobaculum xiamenense TaxID=995050 RepID=A0A846QWN9_9BACT|nr:GGDEF domain-containing protein [Desulfobaculum xiamenense]NJB69029.1 diguanylate cyclase (GGDEF)-like protein [Desulfobaculum xiamenense]